MKTYVLDIIPKIQRFGNKLDHLTLLLNHHWVVFDTTLRDKVTFIFRNGGQLLISTNGIVEKGNWEYLSENALLVNKGNTTYLFKNEFMDENIIAMNLDGMHGYVLFINESKANTELNSIELIESFLTKKYLAPLQKANLQLRQKNKAAEDLKLIKDDLGKVFKVLILVSIIAFIIYSAYQNM